MLIEMNERESLMGSFVDFLSDNFLLLCILAFDITIMVKSFHLFE